MTDVAPAHEVVKDNINGFVVSVHDWPELGRRIIELIQNNPKRHRFIRASRDVNEHLISHEEYLRRYKKSLTSLL